MVTRVKTEGTAAAGGGVTSRGQGGDEPCAWKICRKAATSRIAAAKAAWRRRRLRLPDRRRRLGIGTVVAARPHRLGARHRSEPADRRRREFSAAGRSSAGAASRATHRRRRRTRWAASSARVLGSTEVRLEADIFSKDGQNYRPPTLVLYRGATRAELRRQAQAAMGPFYCPADQKVYLDTSFFRSDRDALPRLRRRQQILPVRRGLRDRARGRPSRAEPARHSAQGAAGATRGSKQGGEANRIQVQVELQADCLAGVWAKRENEMLERGEAGIHRAGRRRGGVAHRRRDRRRHACSGARRATWCRTRSPTAAPSSASAGSTPASGRPVASCNTFAAAQL